MFVRAFLIAVSMYASLWIDSVRVRRRKRAAQPKPDADGVDRVLRSDTAVFLEWAALGFLRWGLFAFALLVFLNACATFIMFGLP